MKARRNSIALALLAGAVLASGCASRDVASRQELDELRTRVHELERATSRYRSHQDEMEERVFLLQDRLEAARIALGRRGSEPLTRQSVHIGPGAPASTSAPPPPTITRSSAPIPGLPVQRVDPVPAAAPAVPVSVTSEDSWPGEEDEVVITMDEFHSRFDSPAERAAAPRSASPGSGERRPGHPHVDTRGYTLPTTNSAVSTASASPRSAPPASNQSGLAIYRRALDEFNGGEYERSIESLREFIASGPEDDYMDNALFWLGECHYGLGRYQDALANFQQVVSSYPDGNKVPDSLLKVALTYERLSNDSSAREVLSVLVDTYPSTDAARRAEERLRALQ